MKKVRVRIKPRALKDEIVGYDSEGVLVVKVSAPPVEGKANRRLIGFLAKALGVPKKSIKIMRGARSRQKLLAVPDDAHIPCRKSKIENRKSNQQPRD